MSDFFAVVGATVCGVVAAVAVAMLVIVVTNDYLDLRAWFRRRWPERVKSETQAERWGKEKGR